MNVRRAYGSLTVVVDRDDLTLQSVARLVQIGALTGIPLGARVRDMATNQTWSDGASATEIRINWEDDNGTVLRALEARIRTAGPESNPGGGSPAGDGQGS